MASPSRRAARGRPEAAVPQGVPPEFRDQLHPIWHDIESLQAHPVLAEYVDDPVVDRLNMGGRAFQLILHKWAVDHGYLNEFRMADWHALRAAGVIR